MNDSIDASEQNAKEKLVLLGPQRTFDDSPGQKVLQVKLQTLGLKSQKTSSGHGLGIDESTVKIFMEQFITFLMQRTLHIQVLAHVGARFVKNTFCLI